jgi:hypothetical protein
MSRAIVWAITLAMFFFMAVVTWAVFGQGA